MLPTKIEKVKYITFITNKSIIYNRQVIRKTIQIQQHHDNLIYLYLSKRKVMQYQRTFKRPITKIQIQRGGSAETNLFRTFIIIYVTEYRGLSAPLDATAPLPEY